MSSPAPVPGASLRRVLGPVDGAAIVISNVIGVGIFTTPGIIAGMVPRPGWMLCLWAVGGVLALAGALAYAHLARLYPRAGGEYVYLREAFGPLAGFLSGWMSFVAGFSGAIAAGAVGFAAYMGRYWPAAASPEPLLRVPLGFRTLGISAQQITAVAVIFVICAVHVAGLRPGRAVQNTLTGAKVVALLGLVALGFAGGHGSWQNLHSGAAPVSGAAWLLALVPVMFSYSGWNAAAYVAEEVRDPKRNVPRALAIGTGVVLFIYLLVNLLYVYAMPVGELAGVVSGGELAAERLFTRQGADALTPVILFAIAGGLSAMLLVGPRVYFAMARDGVFFAPLAGVNQRTATPAAAIVAQGAWSALLVISGTFEQLLIYTGFAVVLFSGMAAAGLLRVEWRKRTASRMTLAAAGIFAVASAAMLASAFLEQPRPSLAGATVILAGVPLYALFSWRARAR